jgi:hypothetical protein
MYKQLLHHFTPRSSPTTDLNVVVENLSNQRGSLHNAVDRIDNNVCFEMDTDVAANSSAVRTPEKDVHIFDDIVRMAENSCEMKHSNEDSSAAISSTVEDINRSDTMQSQNIKLLHQSLLRDIVELSHSYSPRIADSLKSDSALDDTITVRLDKFFDVSAVYNEVTSNICTARDSDKGLKLFEDTDVLKIDKLLGDKPVSIRSLFYEVGMSYQVRSALSLNHPLLLLYVELILAHDFQAYLIEIFLDS